MFHKLNIFLKEKILQVIILVRTFLRIENHETFSIDSAPFLEVNTTTFDFYIHDGDIDYGHGYKENFKDTLSPKVKQ